MRTIYIEVKTEQKLQCLLVNIMINHFFGDVPGHKYLSKEFQLLIIFCVKVKHLVKVLLNFMQVLNPLDLVR